MMNEQQHEMVLEMTHPSGMQGWYCPIFVRRILFLVPPNREMVIVEPGDKYASHWGSNGGLLIGPVRVAKQEDDVDQGS